MAEKLSNVTPAPANPNIAAPRKASVGLAWAGVVIAVIYTALRFAVPTIFGLVPLTFMFLMIGPWVALLLMTIWWFLYKVREREVVHALTVLGALGIGALICALASHPSMGIALFFVGPFFTILGWAILERVTRPLSQSVRFVVLPLAILVCWSLGLLLRVNGFDGQFQGAYAWRWSPTAEQQFIAEAGSAASASKEEEAAGENVAVPVELSAGDWPGFRGPARDGRVTGISIDTDWKANPPKEVWKHAIGPGWGSVAIVGDYLFTQEQRGKIECVVAYDKNTGKERWVHSDEARFDEAVGGPGPRATPQFFEGRLYVQGASGKLNCLDAATGKVIWMQDISKDASAKPPMWGFSSSPLILEGVVIAVPGGADRKGVLGYQLADGKLLWSQSGNESTKKPEHTYSSAHAAKIDSVSQAIIVSDVGMYSVTPKEGKLLWNYSWPVPEMNRVVQPHEIDSHHWIIGTSYGEGSRLVEVSSNDGAFETKEVWQTKDLKPYFNDFVSYEDHLYGFDGDIFVCVDATTGKRIWKKGRYGNGQVILLADQGLLLVLGEKGEIVLLEANPKKHVELGKISGVNGKTWNHPVLVNDQLFVRNGEEIACYQLKTK